MQFGGFWLVCRVNAPRGLRVLLCIFHFPNNSAPVLTKLTWLAIQTERHITSVTGTSQFLAPQLQVGKHALSLHSHTQQLQLWSDQSPERLLTEATLKKGDQVSLCWNLQALKSKNEHFYKTGEPWGAVWTDYLYFCGKSNHPKPKFQTSSELIK